MTTTAPSTFFPFALPEAPLTAGFLNTCKYFGGNNALYIEGQLYSYHELGLVVKSIYSQIESAQISNKSRIAIICHNDLLTYAAILAISAYGAAYVPIHAGNPIERIEEMIGISNTSLVLSSREHPFSTNSSIFSFQQIVVDPTIHGSAELISQVHQSFAYIMFTSGSSGKPKPVGITKRQANHYLYLSFRENWWAISADDRFLQAFELSFDASVQWLFMPLAIGASIYVPDSNSNKFLAIGQCMMDHRISFAMMVPTALQLLQSYFQELHFPALRYSLFGGEALNCTTLKAWSNCAPNAIFENHYGPTEATIWCFRHVVDKQLLLNNGYTSGIPIGTPHTGISIMPEQKPMPNSPKELFITGLQVISNYLDGSDKGKFCVFNNKTYYNTGDIVLKEGDVYYFKGRVDNQLKVSGYRIEPEEIECAITNITNTPCFVTALNENNIGLSALITDSLLTEMDLRAKLIKKLPSHLIPTRFVFTKQLPTNMNGKIDRQGSLKILKKALNEPR